MPRSRILARFATCARRAKPLLIGSKRIASLRSTSCSKPRATRQEPLRKYRGGILSPRAVACAMLETRTIFDPSFTAKRTSAAA
jgi:hypothetical protein